jgi:phosphoglycerate dehydrogenase-like enzyme
VVNAPRIAVQPSPTHPAFLEAVEAGGGKLVDPGDADGLIWVDARRPEALGTLLGELDGLRWVQLPFAGIENFVPVLDPRFIWTCGKGVYAEPVAEHVLALMLALSRGLGRYARAESWSGPIGRNLLGASVAVIGGGGITESLVRLLGPWDVRLSVVRRTPAPMAGVDAVVGPERLDEVLATSSFIVLALALTPETDGLIGAERLALMPTDAVLVNVARGRHIVTDDLVVALEEGWIAGAGLDVTEPEPLPDGHRLWSLPNCIITPHVGNTPEMAIPLLARRIRDNVARFAAGRPLIGPIDLVAGY